MKEKILALSLGLSFTFPSIVDPLRMPIWFVNNDTEYVSQIFQEKEDDFVKKELKTYNANLTENREVNVTNNQSLISKRLADEFKPYAYLDEKRS